jgi:hypothetical protein
MLAVIHVRAAGTWQRFPARESLQFLCEVLRYAQDDTIAKPKLRSEQRRVIARRQGAVKLWIEEFCDRRVFLGYRGCSYHTGLTQGLQ